MQETNQAFQAKAHGTTKLRKEPAKAKTGRIVENGVVYYDDTIRWPIWQSALLVLGFCGTCWAGIIFLLMWLF